MKPICSGEAAAIRAGAGDQCQCVDCHLFFPGGDLYCYPHGNICEGCHDERTDKGLATEVFGQSPRDLKPPALVLTPIQLPNPVLLSGSRADIDAFADRMLLEERQREQQAKEEVFTEGRQHRRPDRINPHD